MGVWNLKGMFLWVAERSVTACWIIAVVLLLRLLLLKAPKRIRGVLWVLVALRLVCPVFVESAWSLLPRGNAGAGSVVSGVGTNVSGVNNTGAGGVSGGVGTVGDSGTVVGADSSNDLADDIGIAGGTTALDIGALLSYLWLAGITAMMVYTVVSMVRLQRKLREAVCCEDRTLGTAGSEGQTSGTADFNGRIWECDRIQTPFVFGVFRPRIYLPSSMPEDDRVYVIAHEQAHIRRLDHIRKLLGFAILTAYWFHPLVWVSYFLFCKDLELACDERVLAVLGEDAKKPYADALIRFSMPGKVAACPVAFAETGVKERVKNVLDYRKPALWIVIAAVVVCVIAGVCFLTNPKPNGAGNGLANGAGNGSGNGLANGSGNALPNASDSGLPNGKQYRMGERIYLGGMEKVVPTPGAQAAEKCQYVIDRDWQLMDTLLWPPSDEFLPSSTWQEPVLVSSLWQLRGKLQKADTESGEHLWNCLSQGLQESEWAKGWSLEKLKEENLEIYELPLTRWSNSATRVCYYLLHQKNGEIFLAFGFPDEPVPYRIAWIRKLDVIDIFGEE